MNTTTHEFQIEGMSCQHCVRAVTAVLEQLPGVMKVQVEVGKAVVTDDGSVTRDAMVAAIAEEGYRVVKSTGTTAG